MSLCAHILNSGCKFNEMDMCTVYFGLTPNSFLSFNPLKDNC